MGDYNRKELNVATDKPSITGNAIHHYIKYAYGKRAIVFAVSIEHSKHIVADFQKAGISAVHVDGETPTEERDYAINKFREGSINVLSNVELFGEGFDLPAIEVAILLRPTKSLGCYVQQAGRVLRTLDGKREAIILDHAGNCQLHGLPDDERTWSLEGSRKKAQEKPEISVKICPSCFGAQKSYVKACIYCGYIFAVKSREVEHKEGDLVEVNSEIVRQTRTNDLWQAKTRDQLIELGRQRKYRHPEYWAHHILQARQLRKIKGKPVEVSNGNL
jgi:superfamily II DNA or RNA helicase